MKCKLVTQELQAYRGFQWELGKKEVIETAGGELCSGAFFHYYDHPLLAILLNPIHASIKNPRLFLVETAGETLSDKGLKSGSKELTLVEEIELPDITLNQKIAFGILCALEVNRDPEFVLWANNWLSGIDRSRAAAVAAWSATVWSAARAAANAAWSDAAAAADAVDNAAYSAARAADNAANIDLISLAKKALTYN
jgi:hypothetical protein